MREGSSRKEQEDKFIKTMYTIPDEGKKEEENQLRQMDSDTEADKESETSTESYELHYRRLQVVDRESSSAANQRNTCSSIWVTGKHESEMKDWFKSPCILPKGMQRRYFRLSYILTSGSEMKTKNIGYYSQAD